MSDILGALRILENGQAAPVDPASAPQVELLETLIATRLAKTDDQIPFAETRNRRLGHEPSL